MARRSDEREAARAEYMARKEKGGEVNLRQLADDLHLKYDTVRRWKSKDGWDTPTGRKPGGQPGNQNAVGNSGGGAPAGNLNAEKDGAYSRIFFDKLTPAEQGAFDAAPRNGVEALQHEMGLLKLRELKILEKIKEYEDMNPDTLITSSVLDMRVPGKTGKGGKKEDGKVQTMGMYSRDTPFARILKLQDVSSIDYENGLCEIHYPDRDDTVTEMVPFLSNREYRTPEVEDMVLVLHPGDSPEDAVVVGTIWNEKIKPAEGKKGIYRKEFSNKDGQAYRKFDANAKELTDHVDGKHILEAKSLEIKVGGATVTISESGAVSVNSPAGITIKAAGTLELSASTITASAGTVNITGGGGDVVVSGKSLVNHTHTGNLGNQTSPPT